MEMNIKMFILSFTVFSNDFITIHLTHI